MLDVRMVFPLSATNEYFDAIIFIVDILKKLRLSIGYCLHNDLLDPE